MIDAAGNRLPCMRCGMTLWYSERLQEFCRPCATDLGLHRICDARKTDREIAIADINAAFAEGFRAVDAFYAHPVLGRITTAPGLDLEDLKWRGLEWSECWVDEPAPD